MLKTLIILLTLVVVPVMGQKTETKRLEKSEIPEWYLETSSSDEFKYGVGTGELFISALLRSIADLSGRIETEINSEDKKFTSSSSLKFGDILITSKAINRKDDKKNDELLSIRLTLEYQHSEKEMKIKLNSKESNSKKGLHYFNEALEYSNKNFSISELVHNLEDQGIKINHETRRLRHFVLVKYPKAKLK